MFSTERIDHIHDRPHVRHQRFVLLYGDLTDSSNLTRVLAQVQPNSAHKLRAQGDVAFSFEAHENTADVYAIGALRLLEAIRFPGLEEHAPPPGSHQ